jgi:hypothetical protein
MMRSFDYYRDKAAETWALARTAKSPAIKEQFERIACEYEALAAQRAQLDAFLPRAAAPTMGAQIFKARGGWQTVPAVPRL